MSVHFFARSERLNLKTVYYNGRCTIKSVTIITVIPLTDPSPNSYHADGHFLVLMSFLHTSQYDSEQSMEMLPQHLQKFKRWNLRPYETAQHTTYTCDILTWSSGPQTSRYENQFFSLNHNVIISLISLILANLRWNWAIG